MKTLLFLFLPILTFSQKLQPKDTLIIASVRLVNTNGADISLKNVKAINFRNDSTIVLRYYNDSTKIAFRLIFDTAIDIKQLPSQIIYIK